MKALALMATGALCACWSPQARLTDCMFGGATEAQAEECAVKNFGPKGAAYLKERAKECALSDDDFWKAVNCPK